MPRNTTRNGNGPRQSYNRNKKPKTPHKTAFKSKPILHQYGKKVTKLKKEDLKEITSTQKPSDPLSSLIQGMDPQMLMYSMMGTAMCALVEAALKSPSPR